MMSESDLINAITAVLQHQISAAQEEVITKAVAEFETTLRKEVGKAALQVSAFYHVRMDEKNLIITVKNLAASVKDGLL